MAEDKVASDQQKTVVVDAEWLKVMLGMVNDLEALQEMGVDNWEGYEQIDWDEVAKINQLDAAIIDAAAGVVISGDLFCG